VTYTAYRPSLIEFLSGAGIISYGLLAFSLGVRFLKVVDHSQVRAHAEEAKTIKPVPVPGD
jgi:Ni/Fe-hydrogenase subunit HybB-like protein